MDSILGLPLDWKDMEGNEISPIHILVVLKGLDKEGYEVDSVMHTEGMSLSNSLGMARFAVLFIEDEVRKSLNDAVPSDIFGTVIEKEETDE